MNATPLRLALATLSLVTIMLLPQVASAQLSESSQLYGFATWLYQQKDFQRAITEYKRVIFNAPGTSGAEAATFMIASSYEQGQAWERAGEAYGDYLANYKTGKYRDNAMYRQVECAFRDMNYPEVKRLTEALAVAYPGSAYLDDADFMVALGYLMSRQFDDSLRLWKRFPEDHPDSTLLQAATCFQQAVESIKQRSKKSPVRATIMSAIIPGSGQYYAGEKGDGLTAFLINAFLIGLTVNRFDRDDETAGVIIGAVALSFYAGNVRGAATAATNRNQRDEAQLLQDGIKRAQALLDNQLGHPQNLVVSPSAAF